MDELFLSVNIQRHETKSAVEHRSQRVGKKEKTEHRGVSKESVVTKHALRYYTKPTKRSPYLQQLTGSGSNQRKKYSADMSEVQRANLWLHQSSNVNVTTHYSTRGSPRRFPLAGMEVTAVVQMGEINQKDHTGTRVIFTWVLSVASRMAWRCFMLLQVKEPGGLFIALHNRRRLF